MAPIVLYHLIYSRLDALDFLDSLDLLDNLETHTHLFFFLRLFPSPSFMPLIIHHPHVLYVPMEDMILQNHIPSGTLKDMLLSSYVRFGS